MIKRVLWVLLLGVFAFLTASLVSFSPHDSPSHFAAPLNEQPANWCGWVGAATAYQAYHMLGPGVWVILAGVAMYLLTTAFGRAVDQLPIRVLGIVTAAVAASGYLNLLMPQAGPMPEGNGGLIAIAGVEQLFIRFNFVGTALLLGMVLFVGAMLAADEVVLALPRGLAALARKLAAFPWPKPVFVGSLKGLSWPRFGLGRGSQLNTPHGAPGRGIPLGGRQKLKTAPARSDSPADIADPDAPSSKELEQIEKRIVELVEEDDGAEAELKALATPKVEVGEAAKSEDGSDERPSTDEPPARKPLDREALREKIKKLPITFASKNQPKNPPVAPQQDLSGYRFPDIAMLSDPESNFNDEMERLVREQAEVLERSLQTYKIDAQVVSIESGPVITLYDVQPAPGTKVNQLSVIASDLARELKAQNIRIVPNTAGKSTIGIEVPNLKKEKVRLKELMALAGADLLDRMRLPMFLGKDATGEPLIADLAKMPHMLIAGTTGSGKSVCMNSIIVSFLYTRRPDELKLVLVDPKMVEMSQFKDIPHLMCPVVTEMNKAAAILEWAVTKMDERYELFAEAGARDIDSYNAIPWEEKKQVFAPANEQEEAQIPRKLPRIVFIIDELADLMMTNKEVETFIVRLAQKARAVGLHLILATQRPQANVVTGLIKGNMPCRIAFKVASGLDSRIVLDHKGAELLLGQGDMLYLHNSVMKRAQGTLVDDSEVRATVRFLKNVAVPSFEPQLVQLKAPGQSLSETTERDPMFEDSVRIMLETGRGSVSLLQRRLGIGYGRASRLVDEMAAAGILGDHKTGQARECLINLEEWEAMKAMAEADAAVQVHGAIAEGDEQDPTEEEKELASMAADEENPKADDGVQEYEYVDDEDPA